MARVPEWAKDIALRSCAAIVSVPWVRSGLKRLCSRYAVPDRIRRYLALQGAIPISLRWSPEFLVNAEPRNVMVRRLYFSPDPGHDEPETLDVFISLIDDARVFVDVGANQGLFSLIAASRNEKLRVHAFEPNPNVTKLLRRNVDLNNFGSRVTVHPEVVSNETGVIEFRVPTGRYAAHGSLAAVSQSESDGAVIKLPSVRLDDLLLEEVDVIKIDVEGAESRVIEGAEQTLRRAQPSVILEVLEPHDYRHAESLLQELGYRFYRLTAAGPVASSALVADPSRTCRNCLCMPRGRQLSI